MLRAGAPIERHRTQVYTRSLFERFYRELIRSAAFSCREGVGVGSYMVVYARASPHTDAGSLRFDVVCNPEKDEYLCVCKHFEHSGMACRHILKVSLFGYVFMW
jgi:hypothetical protein